MFWLLVIAVLWLGNADAVPVADIMLPEPPLSLVSGEPVEGGRVYLSIGQVVTAPLLFNPARVPQCVPTTKLSALLARGIEDAYRSQLNSTPAVQTDYVQRGNLCSYRSLISYTGAPEVAAALLAAADKQQLCTQAVLATYCEAAFPPDSGYALQSTSGNANPPLPPVIDFGCKEFTFEQRLDHFNPDETRMFAQTYWTCAAAWPEDKQQQEQSGHIIVFLGNESPLGTPKQPIVFENARRLNALVLLVEHRYYGNSLPFPEDKDGKMLTWQYKWLTIEQVMEDTTTVLAHVRAQHQVPAAVPAIVIGGSYGGQIASYHRVVKPGVFAAAVAASAPIYFPLFSNLWGTADNKYHAYITRSVNVNSGSTKCSTLLKKGFKQMQRMAYTAADRQTLAATFKLCGDAATALPNTQAAWNLMYEQAEAYNGYAQVNNQPPLLGQVSDACKIALQARAAGAAEYQAIAAVTSYFNNNGSSKWCYAFTWNMTQRVPDTWFSYAYQSCAQGALWSSLLPSKGSEFYPPFNVRPQEVNSDCHSIFGPDVPQMVVPEFSTDIQSLALSIGGIVFTNGDCDGWAGGSVTKLADMYYRAPPSAPKIPAQPDAKLAFVTYKNASHCTDTHTNTWDTPGEPPAWKQQRAQAMDYAAGFAAAFRQAQLSG